MIFTLSDQLKESIISAMENQNSVLLVDAANNTLVEQNQQIKEDEDLFYSLPDWNPSDGFAMRESFVNALHSPVAYEELQSVLHSGRGVFKNFKIVLKKYPEIDKRWHIFKHKIMSERINEWYNSLREIWGLEKLDHLAEASEPLVYDDFSFDEYISEKNREEILFNVSAFLDEEQNLPLEIKQAVYEMWKNQFLTADTTNQIGYVCHSFAEDFAGCFTASQLTSTQEKTMVGTSLFVPEQFRGLGIGTELISLCNTKLQELGIEWIILPNAIIPEFLQPLLVRFGFKKSNFGYSAKIQ